MAKKLNINVEGKNIKKRTFRENFAFAAFAAIVTISLVTLLDTNREKDEG